MAKVSFRVKVFPVRMTRRTWYNQVMLPVIGVTSYILTPDKLARRPVHAVHLEPGSHLARRTRHASIRVNSFHHQAADRPARGLRVVGRPVGSIRSAGW